jgi:serine protease Do
MNTRCFVNGATGVLVLLYAMSASALSPVLKELQDAFIALSEKVGPCVVNIDAKTPELQKEYEDLWRMFGGQGEGPNRPGVGRSQGSGFIYDKQGYIVTNNHVVEGATSLIVRLSNGDEYVPKIIGQDQLTDLAVIKIEPRSDLSAAVLGNSDELKVGQFVIALGSPQGFEGSLSFGHISALGRNKLRLPNMHYQNFIQTDAAINLGNSGGPLVDIDGNVIGINTAILFGAESLGFATAINMVKKYIPTLIADGHIKRGYLGVKIDDVAQFADAEKLVDKDGAYVIDVLKDGPATRAGIQTYDIIRKVDGEHIKNAADLQLTIADIKPGSTVNLEVLRNKDTLQLALVLEELPEAERPSPVERGRLGIDVRPLVPEERTKLGIEESVSGVIVRDVESGSAADDAGIQKGDVIVEVAKTKLDSVERFNALMDEHAKPGVSVILRVIHQGEVLLVPLKVPLNQK